MAIATAALCVSASRAEAHAGGIVSSSCDGCHSGGGTPTLTLTADPATFNPGDSITLTLAIMSPSIHVGGAYITTNGVGSLTALAGEGLAVNGTGLTHTAPKTASGSAVTFRFGWKAPSKPGAVAFQIAALGGNGNNSSSGDAPGVGLFQWVFGCAQQTFYRDSDGDGYGASAWGILLACAGDTPPAGYAARDGDCDENDRDVNPGAPEVCDKKDNDCNGQVDENVPPVTLWPDGDGDGYYKFQSGTSKMGCGNVPGYAAKGGDCDDADPAVHPGVTEICNMKDDNCDGQIDERARPQCGVGWCARYSTTCDPADCHPGPPAVEVCNMADDDCDGEIDEDVCPSGMPCTGSQCADGGMVVIDAGGDVTGSGSGGATAASGGISGGGGTVGASGGIDGGPLGSGGAGGPGARAAGGCVLGGQSGTGSAHELGVVAGLCLGLTLLLRGRRGRTAA